MNENRAPTRRGGSPRLGAVVATFPTGRAAHTAAERPANGPYKMLREEKLTQHKT